MTTRLLRLTVHDPGIVAVLDDLKTARKQSAFVVAALRHFLLSKEGLAQLAVFVGPQKRPQNLRESDRPKPPAGPPKTKTNLDDIFG